MLHEIKKEAYAENLSCLSHWEPRNLPRPPSCGQDDQTLLMITLISSQKSPSPIRYVMFSLRIILAFLHKVPRAHTLALQYDLVPQPSCARLLLCTFYWRSFKIDIFTSKGILIKLVYTPIFLQTSKSNCSSCSSPPSYLTQPRSSKVFTLLEAILNWPNIDSGVNG